MVAPIDAGGGPSTATVTVLFCDLVGSTDRQSRLGDEAADRFRRAMFEALGAAASTTGGEIVKNTGDGVMVVFRHSAVDAVTCSVTMHELVEGLDPAQPATLRVGMVTPYVGPDALASVAFASTATTQTLTGLTNGTSYESSMSRPSTRSAPVPARTR
jgi:hypothetical protein